MKTVRTLDLLTKAGWAWHATIYIRKSNNVKKIYIWETSRVRILIGNMPLFILVLEVSAYQASVGNETEWIRHAGRLQ